MNRIKSLIMLVAVAFLLTGCVKFNANMEIRKDKSLSYSIIYAMDSALMGDEEIINEEDQKELEEEGFKLEPYEDDKYKGVSVSKDFSNIDEISVDSDVTYNVSGLLDNETNNQEVFSVKKGFLKNTYTAKFTFNTNDSDENEATEDDEEIDSNLDLSDSLTEMTNSMDLSFNVKLPYKAISNNATNVENDGKDLKWELKSGKTNSIEFSFALYNMTNVYIAAGIAIALVAIALVMIFKRRN